MNNYFCSAAKIKDSQNELQNYMSKQIPTSMVCETVTRSEIINIVSAFRDNKSPHPDNISPKILKPILSYVIGMYFDLQKAFDTVDNKILLQKLYNYGIHGIVHDWFQSYLSNR